MDSTLDPLPAYAELHCLSNFSFLRGASHPEELVMRAAHLGYTALALTDECSLAGVVRAHIAAKKHQLKLIIGTEVTVSEKLRLVLLATNRNGYGQLSVLITQGRRGAQKGKYHIALDALNDGLEDCLAILLPESNVNEAQLHWVAECFQGRTWIGFERFLGPLDRQRLQALQKLSQMLKIPLVAAGDVNMHVRGRRALQDVLTAIRLGCPVAEAGLALYPNGERHLRPRHRLAGIYPPELLAETMKIAALCRFSLDELRYEYPEELIPPGIMPNDYLRQLTEAGIRERWPKGISENVRKQIEHELTLISELHYEPYFLTVYDIVQFARARGILCQGRGSAANSAICYCLGITEVDPALTSLLFERFISKERNEPPDIDVDFEHERREEVIQYLYARYGRDRAALAATVITYRPKSAIRDVGKALGLDLHQVDRLAKSFAWADGKLVLPDRLQEEGFDTANPTIRQWPILVNILIGFPRHLSQHVGGFVISKGPLSHLVPIENAAMADRTVIQWDKNDLDALGLLKIDVLALGMLTAIHRAMDLVNQYRDAGLTLSSIPPECPEVYKMLQRADSVGIFQVESRAQMAMLPRLKPTYFYDLVIEVALVRPGPIQGQMVHPYLRRRQGLEAVSYPNEAMRHVLERTLGVPIFQEQVMQVAMVAAGFTAGEADSLRRAMASWRRKGGLEPFQQRLRNGMRARGYEESFAQQICRQVEGFAEYGFPESHAASFALLVYVSAWLKCHEPAAFTAALLNSQPMGFYAPAQLIQDARRHGVDVRPVDVQESDWDCTLEKCITGPPTLRLGLRLVKGLSRQAGETVVIKRQRALYSDVDHLVQRTGLSQQDLQCLAAAGALASLAGHRHLAQWQVLGKKKEEDLLAAAPIREARPLLRRPTEGEDIVADYRQLGFTLGRHPLALLRGQLTRRRFCSSEAVNRLPNGRIIRAAGLVTARQRPDTATGVVFLTLEDEFGTLNVVVWNDLAERQRTFVSGARLLGVSGKVEKTDGVLHLVAVKLEDHSALLGRLNTPSRDFC